MQILVDTDAATPRSLRMALVAVAVALAEQGLSPEDIISEAMYGAGKPVPGLRRDVRPPAPPIGKPPVAPAPVAPLPPGAPTPPAPVVHPEKHPDVEKFVPPAPPPPPSVPAGTPDEEKLPDPAALFGGANVDPYLAGITNRGTPATAPAVPAAQTATSPSVPAVTLVAPNAGAPAVAPSASTLAGAASPAGVSAPLVPTPAGIVTEAAASPAGNASTATGQANAGTADPTTDKRGWPWDHRIHSETRKLNQDGTWRNRRHLAPDLKAAVEAELAARVAGVSQVSLPLQPPVGVAGAVPVPAPAPPVPVVSAAAAPMPTPAPAPPVAGGVLPAPAPPPPSNVVSLHPAQPAAAVPVPPATGVGVPNPGQQGMVFAPVTDFRSLLNKVNQATAAGLLTQDQLTEACKANGANNITELYAQPALVPEVDRYLSKWLGAAA